MRTLALHQLVLVFFSVEILVSTMKVLVFLSLVALASCRFFHKESTSDIVELVKGYGYSIETYDVTTSDGYILDLYRVRSTLTGQQRENLINDSEEQVTPRRPILLMHGLMSSSIDFVIGGPKDGLAFQLANRGYDVFLGNARGTVYGQRHTTLNPKKDAAFWRFCFNEVGTKDLPAIINKVLDVTGKDKLMFLGHMEGTTSFYAMASELPEINSKVEKMISLGPVAFLKNSEHDLLERMVSHLQDKAWIMKNVGISTFLPSRELLQTTQETCMTQNTEDKICKNTYFLMNGFNSKNLNMTTLNNLWSMIPSSVSVREILHLTQLKSSGKFAKFIPDLTRSNEVQEYDLTKITCPVGIIYTPLDKLSHIEDVETLTQKLPLVFKTKKLNDLTNNLDLIFSKNVAKNVYHHVFRMLAEQV